VINIYTDIILCDLPGHLTHQHANLNIVTCNPTSGSAVVTNMFAYYTVANVNHGHYLDFSFAACNNMWSRIMLPTSHVDSALDLTSYGNDLFYRHIAPDGSLATPVNISLIKQLYPSFEGVVSLMVLMMFISCGLPMDLNTTPSRARVCYKKIASGTLGARVDITSADLHMEYPSMDIDVNGDVHAAWFNSTNNNGVCYVKSDVGVLYLRFGL